MSLLRTIMAALAALCFTSSAALAQPDVSGWWRADIAHGDEVEPFYFHFDTNDEGARRARMTIPVARMYEVQAGPYEVAGGTLGLPAFGLSFAIAADGSTIEGVFPPEFVTTVPISVRFVRADAPAPPVQPAPESPAPAPLWTALVGGEVWAGLTLDAGRALFIATADGRLVALSPATGAELWRVNLGSPVHATPTLHRRRLYVATDAALVALDARNGRELWRAAFGAERAPRLPISDPNSKWDHYSSSAVVDDRLAVVGSRDGCVYALDTRNGAERWKFCTEDLVTATPALTRDAVYFAGYDRRVYALARADGRELWRFDAEGVVPRDVIIADGNVIAGSRSYDIFAIDAQTGAQAWRRYVWYSWIDSPPVLADGRIYSGMSDAVNVFAFDSATGARVWAAPVPGWTWPRVAVGRQHIYAGVVGGEYSAPRAGGFAAIDSETGELRWLYESERPERGLFGFAAAAVARRGRVFTADLTGRVYAFADPEG
jgi:outer membrane protein assembly factor BamB